MLHVEKSLRAVNDMVLSAFQRSFQLISMVVCVDGSIASASVRVSVHNLI